MSIFHAQKTVLTAGVLGIAVFGATPSLADCKAEIAAYLARIDNEEARLKYTGREADHPLVLKMTDGRLVDLSGYIVKTGPAESWMGDRQIYESVRQLAGQARQFADENRGGECDATLGEIRRITQGS